MQQIFLDAQPYLAAVTAFMTFLLVVAHGFKALAVAFHAQAQRSKDKNDDAKAEKLLALATQFDTWVVRIAHFLSGFVNTGRQP